MKFTTFSVLLTAALATIAVGAGLGKSYQLCVVAVAGLGSVLSLRAVGLGGAVRPLTSPEGDSERKQGPVASMMKTLDGAKRGSFFFQNQIAVMLRQEAAERPGEALPREIIEPPKEGRRLKGDRYLTRLEAAVKVFKDD